VAALSLAVAVAPASAGKPTIQRMPFEDHFVAESCGFPVQVDAIGTVVDISSTDALGNVHFFEAAPQAKLTLTNLVTAKTIIVNNSGPGDVTFGADGSFTQVGTGLWAFIRGNPVTLEPGLFLTQGRFVLSFSASGVRTFTLTGTTTDLCAQLA
jgi:hypothetical protein